MLKYLLINCIFLLQLFLLYQLRNSAFCFNYLLTLITAHAHTSLY